MLATWFFAYSESVDSTRQLEAKCKYDTRYMYTSGMLMPDHSTLSRFRQSNLDLMQAYFVEILLLAQQMDLSDFKAIAIDGTKIQASASPDHSKTSDELSRYLAAVRQHIVAYLKRCDEHDLLEDDSDDDDSESVQGKLEELKELEATLLERQKQLNARRQRLKKEYRKNHQINLVEPDAPNMRFGRSKSKAPAYNAQVATDRQSHLIVSNDVVTDANDSRQFRPQHQAVEANLGRDRQRQFDADSGYHSMDELAYIEQNQIDAVIAEPTPEHRSVRDVQKGIKELLATNKPLKRGHFVYEAQQDCYHCPAGHKLRPRTSKGQQAIYLAKPDDCRLCLVRHLCLSSRNKSGVRNIVRDQREAYAERMYLKLQTVEAKRRMRRRAVSVEPVIGNLKQNLGFRRFKLRGLVNVRGEFTLMCIAHNLNKLFGLMDHLVDLFLSSGIAFIKYNEPLPAMPSFQR
jgi:transposase